MIGISFHSGGLVDKPLPWVIEHLGQVGYDAIEIVCGPQAHIRTGEPLAPQLTQTRALLAQHGLAVSAINPYTMPAMVNLAKEDRDKAISFWSLLMDIAVEMQCPNVNFLPGWLPDGDAEAWKLLIDVLKVLTARAEQMGLNLAIHNHESMIIDSPDKCLLLIEQVGSPALKVLCDITNFYILGGDVAQAVHRVAPHIVHCHEKGVKNKYPYAEFIPAGDEGDQFDFDAFAVALGEIGYERYISVECFSWQRAEKTQVAYDMISRRLKALGLRNGR
jgi:sugar phosphate isomerase/epimerase